MGFKDHFSDVAGAYRQYRPRYPQALFRELAARSPGVAWDSGCGSGQATEGLSRCFDHVYATDPSMAQVSAAPLFDNVTYLVASAEESTLSDASVDLAIAAQAVHWFDLPAFEREVRRVVKPGGLVVLLGYGLFESTPQIDRIVREHYLTTLAPHWPKERLHIDRRYSDLTLAMPRLSLADFAMEASWSVEQLLGYLGTWSAVHALATSTGRNLIAEIEPQIRRCFNDERIGMRWSLIVHAYTR
ncbi:MAG: class I SAM-dependent methyltransferase [Myxococcota bacterium]